MADARIRIGISGWTYPSWRGVFYPKGLPHRRELTYASRCFNSIEINGTFYALQRPDSFQRWYQETPEGFVFAIKGGRFITHMKKLNEVATPLANFFASGVLALREKLGPILWQLPASVRFDEARFERFFDQIPRNTEVAAKLADRHDHRVTGRAWTIADAGRPIRHAVEVRHESFRTARFIELLRRQDIALVFADAVDWPYIEDVTADFIYLRLHGSEELYVSGYDDAALDNWARRVRVWAAGGESADAKRTTAEAPPRSRRDVYVYFDNDAKVRAPFDAMNLAQRLV
ncbi:DUF72 domain-containing protein [Rhodospirillaceae bacterium SYSU D60014]|uniref:DUF72 domain-containing protein n=1 Tax=Virgifigura deserti TaxID=2268457 RepID=UPI000E66172B